MFIKDGEIYQFSVDRTYRISAQVRVQPSYCWNDVTMPWLNGTYKTSTRRARQYRDNIFIHTHLKARLAQQLSGWSVQSTTTVTRYRNCEEDQAFSVHQVGRCQIFDFCFEVLILFNFRNAIHGKYPFGRYKTRQIDECDINWRAFDIHDHSVLRKPIFLPFIVCWQVQMHEIPDVFGGI